MPVRSLICVLLLLAAVSSGCDKLRSMQTAMTPAKDGKPGAPPGPPAGPPPPPQVFFVTPDEADVADHEDFTGRTVATKTIDLRARVTGYLDRINFKEKEGGDVAKGEVLFEIDPRPYEAEVLRTEATLRQSEAHQARLELDFKRASTLIASKSVSREQYDQVNGDKAEAEAAVEVAKANVRLAKLNLNFTKVRAPIAGRVGRTMLDIGNLVKADDTILTTVVAIEPIYAYFEVDERTLLQIREHAEHGRLARPGEGLLITLGLANETGFPHRGSINFYDNHLDTNTGTLQVRGEFKNDDHQLHPGLFVRVRLPIGEKYRALTVPERALGTDQGQKYVYVVDGENKAQYRPVKTGKLDNGNRVILEGLSLGDRVVVSGLQRVQRIPGGAPVTPTPFTEPTAAAPATDGAAAGVANAAAPGRRAAEH